MDVEREINAVAAETLAVQFVLMQVLYRFSRISPEFRQAITEGFDDAANIVEQVAIKFGKSASPEQGVKALRIVEELRTTVLGNQNKPKHAV